MQETDDKKLPTAKLFSKLGIVAKSVYVCLGGVSE